MAAPTFVAPLLGNPFPADTEALEAAIAAANDTTPMPRVMEALEAGDPEGAEATLLALGHARVLGGVDAPVHLEERAWNGLPRPEAHYQRLLAAAARAHGALGALIGQSEAIQRVRHETWAACFGASLRHALLLEGTIRDHDVLVVGETGTGKELVARAVQLALPSDDPRGAPRAELNAAAVPATLIESELFGHRKGAFTGASADRKGRIRSARGGSFFLDEVGELAPETQAKLLRVMETNVVYPLGDDQGFEADVRYVAATHQDLEWMVREGTFRLDLLQRLAGHVIRLPSLRERRADIPALGRMFLQKELAGRSLPEVEERVAAWLDRAAVIDHPWDGNVRELFNLLRSVMLGFDPPLGQASMASASGAVPHAILTCEATLREVDEWYLARVLERVDGNYAAAARLLGLDRATVRRRASKLPEED